MKKDIISYQHFNENVENSNDIGVEESKCRRDDKDKGDKPQHHFTQLGEKRIPVPIVSKIVNGEVIERIKSKVASTTSNTKYGSTPSFPFWNHFSNEFNALHKKDNKPNVVTEEQEGPELLEQHQTSKNQIQ